jgi:hypothetical protein
MGTAIIVGIFTLAGTLLGIFLGHILNSREQAKTRRTEYARLALNPLRANLDRMETVARHILFILASLQMGASKSNKHLINKSLKEIEAGLVSTTWLPQVLDDRLEDSWSEVGRAFGALMVVYSLESPSLIPVAGAQRPPRAEFLKQYQEIFSTDDFAAFRERIAPEPESQAIFDSAAKLITSIVKCREEIRRLSVEG